MAELSLKQITDKLNAEFTGEVRKLIFWYDADAEFSDDVDELALDNAKVYRLKPDEQFKTKYFLERVDTQTNYLLYAPFAKPELAGNHLADMMRYSKEFFADRASLLALDLNMDERCKPVLQQYIKFFSSKERMKAFYDLEISGYTRASIEVGIMAVLCRCKVPYFEEVLRCVLTDSGLDDNRYLDAFASYGLTEAFWQQCEALFGYADEKPSLEKLALTAFVTYTQKVIHADIPPQWQPFISFKGGNIVAFMDNLMNNMLYSDSFDAISARMFDRLNAGYRWESMGAEALVDCNLYAGVDEIIISWMTGRLLSEDVAARLNGRGIAEICDARRKMHFGERFRHHYDAIESALALLSMPAYCEKSDVNAVVRYYIDEGYKADAHYRQFYFAYDAIEDNSRLEPLRSLVERVYTNDRLNPVACNYAMAFMNAGGSTELERQLDFYKEHVMYAKERVVVIVSDALRYEVGQELFARLQADEKCTVTISTMQSVLPSVTRLGMAALLPHKRYDVVDADHALLDGRPSIDIGQREDILKSARPDSRAVRFDEIRGMNVEQLRGVFARQGVVYVYHDQIDARGDKPATENEVFAACDEAIGEICWLIRRLTTSANTSRFIVTADHGFIYRRDKLLESGKIGGMSGASRRYVLSGADDAHYDESGVGHVPLGAILGGADDRVIEFPLGSDVFKAAGAAKNYAHGGCSPQEMIVPLIKVRTERAHKETSTAKITLVSLLSKITNLITALDFMQTEPVSDVVKETKYRIFFVTDDGEKISSENHYVADSREKDASKRVFKLRFSFKNQQYGSGRKYYIVAIDDKSGMEVFRREVKMDIAFADDFGF